MTEDQISMMLIIIYAIGTAYFWRKAWVWGVNDRREYSDISGSTGWEDHLLIGFVWPFWYLIWGMLLLISSPAWILILAFEKGIERRKKKFNN